MPNNLSRNESRDRARLLSVASYEVEVDLTDGSDSPGETTFRTRTRVRFTSREPGAATWVDLTATALLAATLNGVAVAEFDGHRLQLPDLASDNELIIESEMAYMNTGAGVHRFVDNEDGGVYLYSQFEAFDAHRMYACFDQPDLKATFLLTVRAPRNWVVVSNGVVLEAPPQGDPGTWRFAETPIMSTYITALVAGPFVHVHDEHDGIALGLYCRRSMADHLDAQELFSLTRRGFDFYHREFARRYPFGKYDQIFVAEMAHGAMENAGCVTITEDLLFSSKVTEAEYEHRAMVILHEMAHMWFGNLVTMRWWDDLWLNESFATYASILCMVEATAYKGGWTTLANEAKTMAYAQDQMPSTHPVAADMYDVEAIRVNFDAITYAKGASVLKQLVAWVGGDAFREGMRAYFRAHAWNNTSLQDLLIELEKSSGRDLSGWSKQWLETAGVNTLRPVIELDEAGLITRFSIEQEAPAEWPTLRSHRLAVGFYDMFNGKLLRSKILELDVVGARTEVPALLGLPRPALVLLNDDDLAYTKIRLDETSLNALVEHVGQLEGSLPRALCWTAAWDMTRDAEMPTRDYLALVLRGISGERDIGVIRTLLQQVTSALTLYADPVWAPTGRAALATAAQHALEASAPGSDNQLVWAHTALDMATTPDQVAQLRRLLKGSQEVMGLHLDQDLRWRLVLRLVVVGELGESDIAVEEERDSTALGQRNAVTCRAAMPSPASKEAAWAAMLETEELSQVVQAAAVNGFAQPEQSQLLEPFVDRFFDVVGDIWASRGAATAHALVTGLYPRHVVSKEVVHRTDAYLASGCVPAPLARLLVEGRDGVQRAIAARACDARSSVVHGALALKS